MLPIPPIFREPGFTPLILSLFYKSPKLFGSLFQIFQALFGGPETNILQNTGISLDAEKKTSRIPGVLTAKNTPQHTNAMGGIRE